MPDSRHRVASCVWRLSDELLLALDDRFREPVDSYVNGSQVWLRDDGPGEIALEWRLHPVAGFVRPPGVETFDLMETVVWALRTGAEPPAPIDQIWGGLEAFACDGDDVEPVPLAAATAEALGIAPGAFGLVDHEAIGDRVEATGWKISVIDALFEQLTQ
jgi:hypothetical protein